MRRRFAFLAGAGFLLCRPAFAETSPAGGTEEQRLKAAETLYVAGGYQQDMSFYVDTVVRAYAVTIARRGGRPTPETQEKLADIVRPDFQALLETKRHQVVGAFAQHLSVADMNATIAWCNSPAGHHFRAAKAEMLTDIYASSRSALTSVYDQVWKTRQAEFAALGLKFGGSAH